MDDVSKAIYKASGLVQAAQMVTMRAIKLHDEPKAICAGRIARVLDGLADDLRDAAVKTRSDAERADKQKWDDTLRDTP